MAKQDSSR